MWMRHTGSRKRSVRTEGVCWASAAVRSRKSCHRNSTKRENHRSRGRRKRSMNKRAAAYLAQHSVTRHINGVPEVVLPLEKLQGFLDLLGPNDVPPEYQYIQKLYNAQATWVTAIQEQVAHYHQPMEGTPAKRNRRTDQETT